jgi:hypothetical protein
MGIQISGNPNHWNMPASRYSRCDRIHVGPRRYQQLTRLNVGLGQKMKKQRADVILISIAKGRERSEYTCRQETYHKSDRGCAHLKTAFKLTPADISIWQISTFPLSNANHRGVAVVSSILISRGNHSVSALPNNPIISTCARGGTHVIETFTSAPADISIRITPTCS